MQQIKNKIEFLSHATELLNINKTILRLMSGLQKEQVFGKEVDVDNLNLKIQILLIGNLLSYKSIDTVCNDKSSHQAINFPTEFLNSLDLPGMPPHNLQLKVGSAIILLRNLNPPRLCNGTQLAIKKIMKNVIEASILNSKI